MLREGKSTAGDFRIPSGCAVSSVFSRSGKRLDGSDIIRSIEIMHDRSNGLGGGFAGYGIYPEYAEQYAFHVFYNNVKAKEECEKFINEHFDVVNLSKIPIRKIPQITDEPLIWRYFVTPLHTKLAESQLDEDEFTARCVTSALRQPHRRLGHPLCRPRHHAARHHHHVHHRAALESPV